MEIRFQRGIKKKGQQRKLTGLPVKSLAANRICNDSSTNPTKSSANRRCFRVSSDGGLIELVTIRPEGTRVCRIATDPECLHKGPRRLQKRATFRANSSQVDRSQLCMPEGSNLNETSLGTVLPLTTERVARKRITKPPDLELVEHGKPLERCVRPMKSREYLLGLTTQ